MAERPILVWLRNDLRLADHAALSAAAAQDAPVLLLFVLDDETPGAWALGGASRWWLHKSLESFARDVAAAGGALVLRQGRADEVIEAVAAEVGAGAVYASLAVEPWLRDIEARLGKTLAALGIGLRTFPGPLLHDPATLRTRSGGPFKVYTPFWRALIATLQPERTLPAPKRLRPPAVVPRSDPLPSWGLLPQRPDWAGGLAALWKPGEEGARERLGAFLDDGLEGYAERRNRPDVAGTSRLSPHLHWGEISPRQCWQAVLPSGAGTDGSEAARETFLKELAWREFSAHLLHHFPALPEAPFRPEFRAFPWRDDAAGLSAWQRGETGYPIVDAGMRELWATGWMHNRVRMIAASFLTKHLLIPWQTGEAWFWDTLVDADLASNAASWQWVAGSGADAAPYFRIFNPVLQGESFDPDGAYVRRWVPELGGLAAPAIHAPWRAGEVELSAAGVRLGVTYPHPIVDHAMARQRALAAFGEIRGGAEPPAAGRRK